MSVITKDIVVFYWYLVNNFICIWRETNYSFVMYMRKRADLESGHTTLSVAHKFVSSLQTSQGARVCMRNPNHVKLDLIYSLNKTKNKLKVMEYFAKQFKCRSVFFQFDTSFKNSLKAFPR